MNLRELAEKIIDARHCLIGIELARYSENIELLRQWESRFNDFWDLVPTGLQTELIFNLKLRYPVIRMVERKGMPYYRGRIKL